VLKNESVKLLDYPQGVLHISPIEGEDNISLYNDEGKLQDVVEFSKGHYLNVTPATQADYKIVPQEIHWYYPKNDSMI
jgi:hypothetical protein